MLQSLISDLLADFTVEDGVLLISETQATRFVKNSLPLVCLDIDQQFTIQTIEDVDTVVPEPTALIAQVWFMRAKLTAIDQMITNSAGNVNWKSGNKSMDSQNEAVNWQRIQKSLTSSYDNACSNLNPAYGTDIVEADIAAGSAERGIDV